MPLIQSISQTPTITAGLYSTADAVGGLLTFANLSKHPDSSAILRGILVKDESLQAVDLELILFSETFSATDDNAAMSVSDADILNCLGSVAIDQWFSYVASSIAVIKDVNLPIKLSGASGSLFGQLVARSTPTYVATDDLTVTLLLER